jgi:hypothetical protein
MKSPRPPRMAGRRAAILLIRLVAPALRSAALSLLARRPLRVFGWSTLSIDALLFVSSSTSSRTTPFLCPRRARAPGSCSRLRGVSCAARLPSPAALRGAAGLLLSCTLPARGGRSAERRTREGCACEAQPPCQRDTGRPGRRDGACRRSTVAVCGPRDHASRIRQCLGPCRAFPRPAARPAVRVPRPPDGGCTALSGRHTPLRLRTSPETPLNERGWGGYSIDAVSSQWCIYR